MNVRKTLQIVETINTDAHGAACDPITRVAALAVIRNPFAGKLVEDLSALFDMGGQLGEQLMDDAVRMLANAPVSYGKAAIVGIAGDMEQGGAMIHPKLGKPMRAAVGGGVDRGSPIRVAVFDDAMRFTRARVSSLGEEERLRRPRRDAVPSRRNRFVGDGE